MTRCSACGSPSPNGDAIAKANALLPRMDGFPVKKGETAAFLFGGTPRQHFSLFTINNYLTLPSPNSQLSWKSPPLGETPRPDFPLPTFLSSFSYLNSATLNISYSISATLPKLLCKSYRRMHWSLWFCFE